MLVCAPAGGRLVGSFTGCDFTMCTSARRALILGLVLAICALQATAAEVYKWIAPDGSVHYGDKPPRGVKAERVEDGVSVIPSEPLPIDEPPPAGESAPPLGAAEPAPTYPGTLEARRQQLIRQCEQNRGVDCEAEADALMGYGAADAIVYPYPCYRPECWRPLPPRPPKPPRPPRPRSGTSLYGPTAP
jgi:hypothetical protein